MTPRRSILFSPAMAKAVWDGKKTQTRRLAGNKLAASIAVGETIWVREAFYLESQFDELPPRTIMALNFTQMPVWHAADGEPSNQSAWGRPWGRRRQSIHMPRWACRMHICISGIICQRLHDITEADAKAEGAPMVRELGDSYIAGFREIWDAINKDKPGARWLDNPDVIALTFSVERTTQQTTNGGYFETKR